MVSRNTQAGVQLVELMITLAIVAVIAVIAVPSYTRYIDRVNNAAAVADINAIEQAIERYYVQNNHLPDSLAETGSDGLTDPWGNSYQYLRIDGAALSGLGMLRKDKNLNPVNSDYDLYSKGKDGQTRLAFTALDSLDDIVRANNGRFVGAAADY